MGYLGLQDATRKRYPIYQTLWEWTGSINLSLEGVVLFVTVSEKKRNKAKYMNTIFYHILFLLQPGLTFS